MRNLFNRRVKIVCTLGPATQSSEMIEKLIDAGMNVARLNFSHGDAAYHTEIFHKIRAAAKKKNKVVGIMQDLQGPKLRAGKLPASGVDLKVGSEVILFPEGEAIPNISQGIAIPISREIALPIAKSVKKGARVLFDDGKFLTFVKKVDGDHIYLEVSVGGKLTSHKGINLPGTPLPIPAVTEKDLEDLTLGLKLGVDAVALSFVRSSQDIDNVRTFVKTKTEESPLIIAKMEREEAVENQDSIIDLADGILIARGDMAVELGAHHVPIVQKQLIRACLGLGVPVITATQMLESMVSSPTPTRAEANDVANAVFDGTDAVMLSGETASGAYPIEAVSVMTRIIIEAERSADHYSSKIAAEVAPGSVVEAIGYGACRIAKEVGATAIICLTHSGRAARTAAKFRPDTPILAMIDREESLRKLSLVWGVEGVPISEIVSTDELFSMVESALLENGFAQSGDLIVVTAGIPSLKRGTTNMIKVHQMGASTRWSQRS